MNCTHLEKFFIHNIGTSYGCTEPGAIGYNISYAGKYLKNIKDLNIEIDKLTYKNAFNAGIPNGKDFKGTKWALIFGFYIGNPELKLEIFNDLKNIDILKMKYISKKINYNLKIVEKDDLYIKTKTTDSEGNSVEVLTYKSHDNIIYLDVNGEIKINKKNDLNKNTGMEKDFLRKYYDHDNWEVCIEKMYESKNVKELIDEIIKTNMEVFHAGKKYFKNLNDFGLGGAVFSRMNGDFIKVYTCYGSGNKGLSASIPVINYANKLNVPIDKKRKAVLLSLLVTMLVTEIFGAISTVCGVVYGAGAGILAGFLYLENITNHFDEAYNIYISGVGGSFCDGAKGSCAAKAITAVSTAVNTLGMIKQEFFFDHRDGYLGSNFYETINNLYRYNKSMKLFDSKTIDILDGKNC